MKKFLALLLVLAMMLPCAMVAADGAMTDKPLNFAEFSFSDTFGNIRKNIKAGSIDFKYAAYTSRCIVDAIDNLPDYSRHNEDVAPCFKVRLEGQRAVAGHRAGAYLWFSYPANNLTDENNAIFYAGEYEFDTFDTDATSIFVDLKGKLTQLYGEPFYAGNDISAAMGEVAVDDVDRYTGDVEQMQAEYAVWKSSANNGVVVLKNYLQHGDWAQVRLAYISDVADATLSQCATQTGSGNASLEGL